METEPYNHTHLSSSPQIVRTDRSLEQIVFPVPQVCEYLTEDSKERVLQHTECDEQGSKVAHFFEQTPGLHEEMECQQALQGGH